MENQTNTANGGFSQLGISSRIFTLLEKRKFTTPTPIQEQSIPVAIKGDDVIGIAQTGTGKTLAFGIPMLERLTSSQGIGLIIVPTRELALQVEESLRPFANDVNLRTAVLIGGASMNIQLQILRKNPRIIIATPGRLIDHMERFRLSLQNVSVLVLDEADRMLDMGFAPQIKRILESVPTERQTMLFSATMPEDIIGIANRHMKSPVRIEVAPAGTANAKVQQELFFVHKEDKAALLNACLAQTTGTAIVFTRTKHGATKVNKMVQGFGIKSDEIHSNRSLAQRKRALSDFKAGRIRVLVATDIAARGIDVKDISLVVNFDIPENPDDYVHRIGRTGRAGAEGKAITFAMPDQRGDVRDIERLIRQAIELGQMPTGIKNPGVTKLGAGEKSGGAPRKRFQHRDRNFGRPEGQTRRQAARGNYSRGGHGVLSADGDRPQYAGRPQGGPRSQGGYRAHGGPRAVKTHEAPRGQYGGQRSEGRSTGHSYGKQRDDRGGRPAGRSSQGGFKRGGSSSGGVKSGGSRGGFQGGNRGSSQGGYGGRRSGGSSVRTGRSPRSRSQGQARGGSR